ncbi:MAG TPA: hypothetical protein VF636_07955 [Sphingomonas sp.]|jgi:hypothetical protein
MATAPRTAPLWFRVVAVLLIVWGLAGVFACVQQFRLGAEAMGPVTDYDRRLIASLPVWYNPLYAVATGAGLLGALALLTRSRVAVPLLAVSLVAVIAQFGYMFLATDLLAAKGAGATVPFPLFIAAVALLALGLSRMAARRGWIG